MGARVGVKHNSHKNQVQVDYPLLLKTKDKRKYKKIILITTRRQVVPSEIYFKMGPVIGNEGRPRCLPVRTQDRHHR